jgi:hypothetical protein
MTMRSDLLPGVRPVHHLVGWWRDTRSLNGCDSRDGWFGLQWMISLQRFFRPIAGLVVGRCYELVFFPFANLVSIACSNSR